MLRYSSTLFSISALRVAVLSTGIACCLFSVGQSVAEAGGPRIGRPPSEKIARARLRMLDGQELSLSELRGKVVVVNFFAVWCEHSKRQVELLSKYGVAEREQGLRIVGLSVEDQKTTPALIRKLISDYRITYPVGSVSDSLFTRFVESRDIGVPQTLIYGRDGNLLAHFQHHDDAVSAEISSVIERALTAK